MTPIKEFNMPLRFSFQRLASAACLAVVSLTTLHGFAQDNIQALEEEAMVAAVSEVAPLVVKIETYAGQERVGDLVIGEGPTSGLIVSDDGFILSSAFNFVQNPNSILVTIPGQDRKSARIVARDHSRKLVLLKVEVDGKLPTPTAVERKDMQVGQWTIAVGRTYDQKHPNISIGVLSAKDRIWGKALQTDAKISPANYGGPIIDIQGRVLGILAPFSPQAQTEVAGAEWYDSGIGFAIPLAEIMPHLEKMKAGNDLHPGLLGIALKGKNVYEGQPEIAAAPSNGPADKAGLKAGDKIMEVQGQKINRQAQLKHILGKLYSGDKVKLVVQRKDEQLDVEVELAAEIKPYAYPFVGVLPMRDTEGFVVRYVYPDSPASDAGIAVGDTLLSFDDETFAGPAEALEKMAVYAAGDSMKLKYKTGDKEKTATLKLGRLPTELPGELPAAHDEMEAAEEQPTVGAIDIKLADEKNACMAIIPENYNSDLAYGLVVWLHPAGNFDRVKLIERWRPICEENDLILLAPQSAEPDKWSPQEVEFISKAMNEILDSYHIDDSRVVVHGYQAGGGMAYLAGFTHRDRVRAIAAVDAALPGRAAIPDSDPILRLAVYSAIGADSPLLKPMQAGMKKLEAKQAPTVLVTQEGKGEYLSDEEFAALIRWIDSLDRL